MDLHCNGKERAFKTFWQWRIVATYDICSMQTQAMAHLRAR